MTGKRKIGASGPSVFPVGLGCMGMSEFYGPADDAQNIQVIHHALERGVALLDTADMYGRGRNEELLARALRGRRDQAFLATKFAIVRDGDDRSRGVSGKPEYVLKACDASLKRLGMDHIDLYYQHRVDPEVPIEDTVGAMAQLVQAGKVKYLGLSEAAPATLRRAHAVHPISALQTELSLWSREPEKEMLQTCKELGVTFVAYSPLGRGMLTGAIQSPEQLAAEDFRRHMPRFEQENMKKNLQLVQQATELAKARGCTPAQLALAWVLSRGEQVVTIPGTRSAKRLDENIAAAEIELSQAELETLDRLFQPEAVAGGRYPQAATSLLNG